MAEKVTVDVTSDDLVAAIQARKSGQSALRTCPVAQALKRQSPGAIVTVSGPAATITKGQTVVSLTFPQQVVKFTTDFDDHKYVDPIRFEALAKVSVPVPATPSASSIVRSA